MMRVVGKPLPQDWRWIRLDEVCENRIEMRDPRSKPDAAFRYVDISSVDNNTKRIVEAKTLLGKDAPSRARQVIRTGDILVATTRPNLNAVVLVPPSLDGEVCSTGFCVLRPKDELDRDYLFAYVQSEGFVRCLSDLVKGALYPAVTDKQVRAQLIPLPPLAEQQRIAAILTEQMAAVERARAAAEAQLKAANALPASYLQAVFSRSEERQWPEKRLADIGTLLPAKSIATNGDSEVTAITTACLTEAGFNPSQVKIARMWSKDATECMVSYGEILIARSNTPELVGRTAMFEGEPVGAVASDLTIRYLPHSVDQSPFIASYLSFLFLRGYWKERAGGASGSMKKITRPQVLELCVPQPPLTEQRRIAELLSARAHTARRIYKTLQDQAGLIRKLPTLLLRRAFNGEL